MPEAATQREEQPKKLHQKYFQRTEFAYARMSATLPVDVTFEDCLNPEFWVNIAHLLQVTPVTGEPDRSGAIIEVRTADHAFYAELYVRAVHDQGLIVSVLREPKYFTPEENAAPGFNTRWNVGKRRHEVIRKSDNKIVAGDFKIKEDALQWINETIAAMKG